MSESYISAKAKIAPSAILGYNVIIEDDVLIGDNVEIGHNVVIRSGVHIGDNCKIMDNALLGKCPAKASMSATTGKKAPLPPLEIGRAVTVGAGCIIYRGAQIGDLAFFGDLATVREDVSIGPLTIIGRSTTVENRVTIGKRCKIESNAYITAMSTVGDYCFVAPEVTFSNDNFLGRTEERKKHFGGPTLRRGARIGANATLLPGIVIGEDALIAAGSVVTRDIPPRIVVAGCPARYMKDVPKEQLIENQTYYDE